MSDEYKFVECCTACEEKVNSLGEEWNDESEAFAGVTLLCGTCYDRAKELNRKIS